MKMTMDPHELVQEHERLVKRLREMHPHEIHDELEKQSKELKQLKRFLQKQKEESHA